MATNTVLVQMFLPMRTSSMPGYYRSLCALRSLSTIGTLKVPRSSSKYKGWQQTCCRNLRDDFLTSGWSLLSRQRLPALPLQATGAAASQAMLSSTTICRQPRPLPTKHRLRSRIPFAVVFLPAVGTHRPLCRLRACRATLLKLFAMHCDRKDYASHTQKKLVCLQPWPNVAFVQPLV